LEALDDEDEYVRAWAVQLLCEDKDPSSAAIKFFAKMAKEEQSAPVRLYLASALQRMDLDDRWDIAKNLVTHAQDADDHNIPKILWYGIEPLVVEDPEQALRLGALSRIPEITRNIARRLATANQFTKLVDEIGNNADTRNLLLMGMLDGLEGHSDASAPANWPKVYNQLRASNDESAPIALQLSLQFGDAVAAEALLDTLAGDQNSLDDRLQAIRGLAALKRPELKPQLLALLDDEVLRTEAIRASASYDDDAVGEALLERYPDLSDEDKLEVVHAMSARPGYGTQLTHAISSGYVPKRDVPAYIARLMLRVVGNRFLEVWGPVEGLSPDSEAAFGKFQDLLTGDALAEADLRAGREVYNQTCYACHQLYGEGGLVGPDLTGANRTDLTYLLGNILTPSAVIKEDYKMTMVFTEDGQVYSGVVAGEDRRQLQLRIANVDEPISIPKSQITDREITDLSMMPEGLLDYVEEQDIINLFAYLQSLEPISMQDMASR
jgi:putative heme-binding domain-containing protein